MKTHALTQSKIGLICAGAGLLFVSAQLQIPLQPVPVTLQAVAVMFLGLFMDRRTAIQTVLLYISLGALGLPVFAGFSNLAMAAPRFGYIIGFLAAVWAMGTLRHRWPDLKLFGFLFALNLLGTAVIFVCGVAWLSLFIGAKSAISLGFLPFVVPGIIKAAFVAGASKLAICSTRS